MRDVDDLVSLRMRSGSIFLSTLVSELSASMLDFESDFRFGGMVDEAFARRR